jgi:hypothetical protein
MRDKDIDDILRQAANTPHEVDPALLDRISGAIAPSLQPVRQPPPVGVLAVGLFLICTTVALAGAVLLGFHGIRNLSGAEIALIFPVLGVLLWIAAISSVGAMTPGSSRRIPSEWVPAFTVLVLIAVFAWSFQDYRVERFVSQGIVCLTAGVLTAIPAGIGSWWLLHRGYAVNPVAAGLIVGTLASLAGVTMLELHCPNFQALHILIWHTAVVPVSALVGAFIPWGPAQTSRN